MITKETRFIDLPVNIKQKIMNIHKLSQQNILGSSKVSLIKFNYLYSQTQDVQTRSLTKEIKDLGNAFDSLDIFCKENDGPVEMGFVEDQLREKILSFKKEVSMYKESQTDIDFCGELSAINLAQCERFESINRRFLS